jgi:hypothetical protein
MMREIESEGLVQSKEGETSISSISESPYKRMSEKEVIFKVFDKHNEAMRDRKKRMAYLHK